MLGTELVKLRNTAWEMYHAGRFSEAIVLWNDLTLSFSHEPDILFGKAACLRAMGATAEARIFIESALEQFPRDAMLLMEYAWLFHHAGQWRQAAQIWADIRLHHPDQATAWWAGAAALREIGDTQTALELIRHADQRFPEDVWCLFESLNLSLLLEQQDQSFHYWQRLIVLTPPTLIAHLRTVSVRVLRLQTTEENLQRLVVFLLEEPPLEAGGIPHLWNFAKELLDSAANLDGKKRLEIFCVTLRNIEPVSPFLAFLCALLHMQAPAALIMDAAWNILNSNKPGLIGTLIQLNENIGRLVVASLIFKVCIAPFDLAPSNRLELLRMSVDNCLFGFNELVRRIRTQEQLNLNDDSKAEGLISVVASRVYLPEDMPAPDLIKVSDRRLKIAICISGQLRGFRQSHAQWEALNLAGHEVSVYVHSWRQVGRRQLDTPDFIAGRLFPAPIHAAYTAAWQAFGGLDGICRRYPALTTLFKDSAEITEDEIYSEYGANDVVLEDDQMLPFKNYSNQDKMFYKIYQAQQLATLNGQSFDLCVRLRPDKEMASVAPVDWHKLLFHSSRERLIYTDSGSHYVMSGPGAGDQIAVGTPELITTMAEIWPLSQANLHVSYGAPVQLTAHSSLAHHLFRFGIRAIPLPGVVFKTLFDAEPIDSLRIEIALRTDIGETPRDALDVRFLEACALVNRVVYAH